MTADTFRGRLGEQTYTDPALFALDVKAAAKSGRSRYLGERDGYLPMVLSRVPSGKLDMGRTPAQLTVLTALEREWLGCWVRTMTGREGQVWSLSDKPKAVWVIIDGQAVHCHTDYLAHTATCSDGSRVIGDPLEGL